MGALTVTDKPNSPHIYYIVGETGKQELAKFNERYVVDKTYHKNLKMSNNNSAMQD